MSEPPPKKKRTILDFFKRKDKEKKVKVEKFNEKGNRAIESSSKYFNTTDKGFTNTMESSQQGQNKEEKETDGIPSGHSGISPGNTGPPSSHSGGSSSHPENSAGSSANSSGPVSSSSGTHVVSSTSSVNSGTSAQPGTSSVNAGTSAAGPKKNHLTNSTSNDHLTTDDQTMEYSPELFSDSEQDSQDHVVPEIPLKKPSQKKDGCLWKGKPLAQLNRKPDCMGPFPPLRATNDHSVFIKVPYTYSDTQPPSPFPASYKDLWDGSHVRMPCSHYNEYPVNNQGMMNQLLGRTKVKRRWEIIHKALSKQIPGPFELSEAILKYNSRFTQSSFDVLHHFFLDELTPEERNYFFDETLPKMTKLALQLPHLITQPIPLLKKWKTRSVTMSQQQIACLLANAFFCTFPRRNTRAKHSEFFNYPSINFNSLYEGNPQYEHRKLEKLKCILHYFKRVTKKMPTGLVTFTRQVIDKFPEWKDLETKLTGIHIAAEGTIEDDGDGLFQVDFANKFLGGGVLGMGCVQEEIRFLICPEMLITRLFTEALEKNESLIMYGCERFCSYNGYADSFEFESNFEDKTPRDGWGRLCTDVVAIDALKIRDHDKQFKPDLVKRELNKAFCGFVSPDYKFNSVHPLPAICTGNWGCGAFGGDKRLKALIQLMAAAVAHREVCYYTFDDKALRDELHDIHVYLTQTNPLGIGTILTLIQQYQRKVVDSWTRRKPINLFQYIPKVFDGTLENTDSEPDSPDIQFSDSLEMQHSRSQYQAGNVKDDKTSVDGTSKTKLESQKSIDYKANTP